MIKYEVKEKKEKESTAQIRLTEGQFEGVEFRYGTINPIEKDDGMQLSFEYEVLNPANYDQKELEANEDFQQVMGDLIVQILEEKIAEENKKDQ